MNGLSMPPETILSITNALQTRLKILFYHTVFLSSEAAACRFISVLRRQAFARASVKVLYLEPPVPLDSGSKILQLCEHLEEVSLRIPVFDADASNIFLPHLDLLPLKFLTADLSAIFGDRQIVHLPGIPTFNHITHLHMSNVWVLWCGSIGLPQLEQLTHLSLHVNTSHAHLTSLKDILSSKNLQVLVLWRHEYESYGRVQCFLSSANISDPRIVIMNCTLFREYSNEDHACWEYAGAIVQWRKASQGENHLEVCWPFTYKSRAAGSFDTNISLAHELFHFFPITLHSCVH